MLPAFGWLKCTTQLLDLEKCFQVLLRSLKNVSQFYLRSDNCFSISNHFLFQLSKWMPTEQIFCFLLEIILPSLLSNNVSQFVSQFYNHFLRHGRFNVQSSYLFTLVDNVRMRQKIQLSRMSQQFWRENFRTFSLRF